jgi:hypothetical protein
MSRWCKLSSLTPVLLFEQRGEQVFVIDLLMAETSGQRLGGANRFLRAFCQAIWVHMSSGLSLWNEFTTYRQ